MGKAKERQRRRHRNATLSRLRPAGRCESTVSHKTKLGERHLFSCNLADCGATYEGAGTFKAVWERAKAEGWRTLKVGRVWQHWCCWVHIPSDVQLADAHAGDSQDVSDAPR